MTGTYENIVNQQKGEYPKGNEHWDVSEALENVQLLLLVPANVLCLDPGWHVSPLLLIVLYLLASVGVASLDHLLSGVALGLDNLRSIENLTLHRVTLLGHLLSTRTGLGVRCVGDGTSEADVGTSVVRAEIVSAGTTAACVHWFSLAALAAF